MTVRGSTYNHPLQVTRSNRSLVARKVFVLKHAIEQVGDGGHTSMGMIRKPSARPYVELAEDEIEGWMVVR